MRDSSSAAGQPLPRATNLPWQSMYDSPLPQPDMSPLSLLHMLCHFEYLGRQIASPHGSFSCDLPLFCGTPPQNYPHHRPIVPYLHALGITEPSCLIVEPVNWQPRHMFGPVDYSLCSWNASRSRCETSPRRPCPQIQLSVCLPSQSLMSLFDDW